MTQTPDILCMEWLQMIVMMATITVTVITIMFTLSHELCQPWLPGKKCQNIITHSEISANNRPAEVYSSLHAMPSELLVILNVE